MTMAGIYCAKPVILLHRIITNLVMVRLSMTDQEQPQVSSKIITGNDTIFAGNHDTFRLFEGGLKPSFISTTRETLNVYGSGEQIGATNDTDLTVNLIGFRGQQATGEQINAGLLHGTMTIRDFNTTDTLMLRSAPYLDGKAAVAVLTLDGHGGSTLGPWRGQQRAFHPQPDHGCEYRHRAYLIQAGTLERASRFPQQRRCQQRSPGNRKFQPPVRKPLSCPEFTPVQYRSWTDDPL